MDAMCAENVLNGTEGIYRNHLFRENVLDGTESWFLTMAWVYPLTPNPQQACHGISIRQSLGDKGFPTPDPNFGKAVLKVKHSFARVQNSGARRTLGACPCRAKMKKAPRKFRSAFLGVGAEGVEPPTLCL